MLTWHNDLARSGLNASETTLTPANVNSASFGLRFNFPVDGQVYAQPLYVPSVPSTGGRSHNVTFVATEHDSVYAIDADQGKLLWHTSLLAAGETTYKPQGCSDLLPEIGITATPVIDPHAGPDGLLYVEALSVNEEGEAFHRIHTLDIASGHDFGSTTISMSFPGTGDGSVNGRVVFDPAQYTSRNGLLLSNGVLLLEFSSHCDHRPYTGWSVAYNAGNGQQLAVFNFAPNGSEAAPWNAGAAPAVDTQGNIFYSTGNGTFDTTLNANGFPEMGDFGNSLVKLNINGPVDYWTMENEVAESAADQDLGSGGVMLLPDQVDANGKTRHLAVFGGKDTNLYIADRDNLGKFNPKSNVVYQEVAGALPNGVWGSPAYFAKHIYYAPTNSAVRSFSLSQGRVVAKPSSVSSETFGYPGPTPSVSANGTGSGIVWAADRTSGSYGTLHAWNARNLADELYTSEQAGSLRDRLPSLAKFVTPTIADGKVIVGTNNSVAVYGLLPR